MPVFATAISPSAATFPPINSSRAEPSINSGVTLTAVAPALHDDAEIGPPIPDGPPATPEFDDSIPRFPRSYQSRPENVGLQSRIKASITHKAARKAVLEYLQATRDLTDEALREIVRDPGRTIATLYNDLYKDPEFPPKAASYAWTAIDASHADQLEQLMQYVSDAEVAPESRMPMLRGLLQRLVELPREPSSFSIASYDFLAGGLVFKEIGLIRNEFEQHLAKTFPSLAESPGAAHWLATQLLERFDPAMLNPRLEDFWYGSPQYCGLKADIDVITSANLYQPLLDKAKWDLTEIRRAADHIRDVLGGNSASRLPAVQSDAALLYAHTYRTANGERLLDLNGPASPDDYGVALKAFDDMLIGRRRMPYAPLEKAIETLNVPPPMRAKIAEQLLLDRDVDLSVKGAARFEVDSCVGQEKTPLEFYLDDCVDSLREFIPFEARKNVPDLDGAYNNAFNNWHEKYRNALKVLLQYAIKEMPSDDVDFLLTRPAVLMQAKMTATKITRHIAPTFSGDPSVTEDIELPGNSSLLLVAKDEETGERRYFLVSLGKGEKTDSIVRRIEPVDGNIGRYIEDHPDIFFEAHALAETIRGAVSTGAGVEQLEVCDPKNPADCFEKTARQLALLNRQKIYDYGYARTAHRETVEQIQKFLLEAFVPGYECANNIYEGNYDDAVVPCTFAAYDIMGLMSHFAKAAREMSKILTKAAPLIASLEMRELLAKQGGWAAAGTIAGHLQPQLAKAGVKLAQGLGVELLRIGDPGYELVRGAARISTSLAKELFGDKDLGRKLYKLLKKDPHTRHAADAARMQRRRAGRALQPRYEGKLAANAHGDFYRFKLPHGARVRARPYLQAYNALGGRIYFYEINGVMYAHDPAKPLVLKKAGKLLHQAIHCRAKRAIGNAACVTVAMLPPRKDALAPQETGYGFTIGRNEKPIYQADPETKRKTYLIPDIEVYPVPRTIAGEKHWIVPMLDKPYELKLTRKQELFATVIDTDYNKLALEAPDAEYPTEGKIVPDSARKGLELIQFTLKNGINACTIRAPYGSFTGAHRVFFGMIKLSDDYILVDLRGSAENGIVKLSKPTEAEIKSYRRFQSENLAAEELRTSKTFSMELTHAGAGSVLRLYRNYNLAPYKALLDAMASKPEQDRLLIAEMIDAYIENPTAVDLPPFQRVKAEFDKLMREQFSSISNVRNFERHLTEAVTQNNDRLDIHWLDPADPLMDETLDTIAKLFPDTATACRNYKEALKLNTPDAGEATRVALSRLRYKLFGKNIVSVETFEDEAGVPPLKNIVFAISGKQQAGKNKTMKVRTITPDEKYIDADLEIARMKDSETYPGQGNRPRDEPSQAYPDFNKNGARLWRGDDGEAKVLRVLDKILENRKGAVTVKMKSMLPPCMMCLQAIAMFMEKRPDVKFEMVFIRHDREGLYASPRARHRRQAVSRVRRARNGWPLIYGRPKPPAGAVFDRQARKQA